MILDEKKCYYYYFKQEMNFFYILTDILLCFVYKLLLPTTSFYRSYVSLSDENK